MFTDRVSDNTYVLLKECNTIRGFIVISISTYMYVYFVYYVLYCIGKYTTPVQIHCVHLLNISTRTTNHLINITKALIILSSPIVHLNICHLEVKCINNKVKYL